MHQRMQVRVALALALIGSLGACVDDPGLTNPAVNDVATAGSVGGAPAPVRLMSRNMYLGANIDHVLFDPVNGPDLAWSEIVRTNFAERAPRLATEIIERMPDLVGLQEVTRYTVLNPATFEPVLTVDWMEILLAYLAPHGYRQVSRSNNFQTYIPMGGLLVHYMDGEAIIARQEVVIHGGGWRHFSPANQVNLDDYIPGLGYNLRGFQWVDARVHGQRLLFVNTHLEVQHWSAVQERQTAELLEFVNEWNLPTFLVGDFNSAANPNAPERAKTATYDMILAAGFEDLWLRGRGRFTNDGPSCCQASDLANNASILEERLDILFARNMPPRKGFAGGAQLHIFGHLPSSRFLTADGYYLWPSDHAGLFGELWLPPGLTR